MLNDPAFRSSSMMAAIRADWDAFENYTQKQQAAAHPPPIAVPVCVVYGLCDHAVPPISFQNWKLQTTSFVHFLALDKAGLIFSACHPLDAPVKSNMKLPLCWLQVGHLMFAEPTFCETLWNLCRPHRKAGYVVDASASWPWEASRLSILSGKCSLQMYLFTMGFLDVSTMLRRYSQQN